MTRLLILDFDGTFTDAHAEAEPFLASFKADLYDLVGRDASSEWEKSAAELRRNPAEYGWRIGGRISAPAIADPYLSASAIAQCVMDEFGVLKNDETRSAILQTLYRKNYALTASVPRHDARTVLEDVLARDMTVMVITNSHTETVQKKVDGLALAGAERLRVIGDARKFVLDDDPRDPRFDALEELDLPGLDARNVITKRGHYYDLLSEIWAETNTAPESTLVCGDIFELDLALPLSLGCRVHLVHRSETPSYEISFVEAHELGSASAELSGVLAQL
jgi:FMN phosphatase YigB (HAD superfamily)